MFKFNYVNLCILYLQDRQTYLLSVHFHSDVQRDKVSQDPDWAAAGMCAQCVVCFLMEGLSQHLESRYSGAECRERAIHKEKLALQLNCGVFACLVQFLTAAMKDITRALELT